MGMLFRHLGIVLTMTSALVLMTLTNGYDHERAVAFSSSRGNAQTGFSQTPLSQSQPSHTMESSAGVVGDCAQTASQSFLPLLSNGTPAPVDAEFALSLPICKVMVQGFSGSIQVSVVASNGFAGNVALTLPNAPTGINGAFTSATIQAGQSTTLTLTIANNAAAGLHQLTVRGTGQSQNKESRFNLLVVEPLIVSGRVEFDTGGGISDAKVDARTEDGRFTSGPVNTIDGAYVLSLPALTLPAKILVRVERSASTLPKIANQKWQSFTVRGAVQMDRILLPNPEGAEIAIANQGGASVDATLSVDELPNEVARFFGRVYDPDANSDLFPGDFSENGQIPLNSSSFAWMVALDAQGNPVTNLTEAAIVRARISPTQWRDLEDIHWGTGRIEIPIYTFNETTGLWEQMGVGWLEDGEGNVLVEEDQRSILAGTFPGAIFAAFHTEHFSFMNVDYASYGPWTLSRIDRDKRNNDCFFKAVKLAKAIALSPAGQSAYGKVNQSGADLEEELADGQGPEIKNSNLEWTDDSQTNGEYNGDNLTGDNPEDEILLNNELWKFCDDNKPEQKDDIVLLLASTILHETAHWKDDVKKNPGANDRTAPDGAADTAGEEGKQLESDLFGGDLHFDPGDARLELDGEPIDGSVKDLWLDEASWQNERASLSIASSASAQQISPLEITISLANSTFDSNANIPVQVTYRNGGDAQIKVLNRMILEDYPLRFEIVHVPTGKSVGFLGGETDIAFSDTAFVTLAPGQTLQKTTDLNRNALGALNLYNLRLGGQYQVKAIYSPFFGLPESESNTVSFTLNPGGTLAGHVTALASGDPVSGTLIYALLGDSIIGSARSDVGGAYQITNLPAATYLLTTRAAGFLRSNQPDVVIFSGQTTTVDLVLLPPPHLAYGQTITGTVEVPTQVYTFTFTGHTNDNVLFRLAEIDSSIVPKIQIYRPDGTLRCEASSSTLAQILCQLDRNGKFAVVVSSFGNEIGRFSLFLQRTSGPSNGTPIAYGETKAGSVDSPGAMPAYTFAGTSGEKVQLRLAEVDSALGPDLRVYRPDGSLLCEASSSTLAQKVCTLDATGTHTILTGSYDSELGAFSLFLQRTTNPANPTPITYGQAKNGDIVSAGEMDAYTFIGTNADQVVLELAEVDNALAPDVRLYRPDGSLLCDASSSTTATLHCTLDATGTHTILAGSFGSETGAYTLSAATE